jgi:hypothetical protein
LWLTTGSAEDKTLVGMQMEKHSLLHEAKDHLEGYTEYGALPTTCEISTICDRFCDTTLRSLLLIFRLTFHISVDTFSKVYGLFIYVTCEFLTAVSRFQSCGT